MKPYVRSVYGMKCYDGSDGMIAWIATYEAVSTKNKKQKQSDNKKPKTKTTHIENMETNGNKLLLLQ